MAAEIVAEQCLAYDILPKDFASPLDLNIHRCPNKAIPGKKWCFVHLSECARLTNWYHQIDANMLECRRIDLSKFTINNTDKLYDLIKTYESNSNQLTEVLRRRQFMNSRCIVEPLRDIMEKIPGGHMAFEKKIDMWKLQCLDILDLIKKRIHELRSEINTVTDTINSIEDTIDSISNSSNKLYSKKPTVKLESEFPPVTEEIHIYNKLLTALDKWDSVLTFNAFYTSSSILKDYSYKFDQIVGFGIPEIKQGIRQKFTIQDRARLIMKHVNNFEKINDIVLKFDDSSLKHLYDTGFFQIGIEYPTKNGIKTMATWFMKIFKYFNDKNNYRSTKEQLQKIHKIIDDIKKIKHEFNLPENMFILDNNQIGINVLSIYKLDISQYIDAIRLLAYLDFKMSMRH